MLKKFKKNKSSEAAEAQPQPQQAEQQPVVDTKTDDNPNKLRTLVGKGKKESVLVDTQQEKSKIKKRKARSPITTIKQKIPIKSKEKFILNVGDEGAILTHVKETELIKRIFVSSPSTPEFREYVDQHPQADIYILVDVLDQTYIQHNLPPVSSMNVGKLVKKKLEKDFDEQDIQSALQLGRETKGRKDWRYLFVSLRNTAPFSDWMDVVAEFSNHFAGIYLLPLETQNLLIGMQKLIPEDKRTKTKWQVLVSHNRVGGFRQIVFQEGKVVFTRIAQPLGGLAPDVIAGNIEQQTLNTIEYVRRLGFETDDGLEIYTISSQEVKDSLSNNAFPTEHIYCYTPHELAIAFNIPSAAQINDRFGDVIIAMHFIAQKKKVLRLFNRYTESLQKIELINKLSKAAVVVFGLAMLGQSIYSIWNIFSLSGEIDKTKTELAKNKSELDETLRSQSVFADNPEAIIDIAELHEKLNQDITQPLTFTSQLANMNEESMVMSYFSMEIKPRKNKRDQIKSSVNSVFLNTNNASIDVVLDNIDQFENRFRKTFREYSVEISGTLDDTSLNFDLNKQSLSNVPINISLTGPQT